MIDTEHASPDALPTRKNIMEAVDNFIRRDKPNTDYFLVCA